MSARVPDRPGRLVVSSFAPDGVGRAVIVDGESEVVSERKAEAAGQNVVVALDRAGEPGFRAPGRAAVRGTTIKSVPQWTIGVGRFRSPRIHPRDAHVTRRARHQRRESMLDAPR